MSVEPEQFREVMGTFATGVTVVTLPTEPPHGMTVNAFSSVSLKPPLCLICVDHETETYEYLSDSSGGFAVNMLSTDQRDLAEHFADMTELEESPFEREAVRTETTGAPIFERSLAYLDCRIDAAHRAGDHTIYVGRPTAGSLLNPDREPLTFYRGEWRSISSEGATP